MCRKSGPGSSGLGAAVLAVAVVAWLVPPCHLGPRHPHSWERNPHLKQYARKLHCPTSLYVCTLLVATATAAAGSSTTAIPITAVPSRMHAWLLAAVVLHRDLPWCAEEHTVHPVY